MRVLIPAVVPATLPISAWPPRLAARLERLREAAEQIAGSLNSPARVEIVPCRSVALCSRRCGRSTRSSSSEARGGACAVPPVAWRPMW